MSQLPHACMHASGSSALDKTVIQSADSHLAALQRRRRSSRAAVVVQRACTPEPEPWPQSCEVLKRQAQTHFSNSWGTHVSRACKGEDVAAALLFSCSAHAFQGQGFGHDLARTAHAAASVHAQQNGPPVRCWPHLYSNTEQSQRCAADLHATVAAADPMQGLPRTQLALAPDPKAAPKNAQQPSKSARPFSRLTALYLILRRLPLL